jgi:superkiller protein 3
LFLAFALDKKNKLEDAEKSYLSATVLKPGDPQAWQGLIKLYQRQSGKKLQQYQHAALKLAEIWRDADEMYKCQDVVDQFIDFARANGDRQQVVNSLDLILPESPIYPALEGRLRHPAVTYQTQAQIVEMEEKKRVNTLIGERRTRIGARLSEVTLEVKREVYLSSRLSYVYGQLINWATDDEVRRTYEEKLLQYCYERLLVWPAGEQKEQELATVKRLAGDMVIIKHPFKLAWDIAIDWQDHEEIKEWDVGILRDYCAFFPDSDLHGVLMGFLTSTISPWPKVELDSQTPGTAENSNDESEDDDDGGVPTSYVPLSEEDRLLIMVEGIGGADSLFAYRLMGEYYQHLEEYETNVELMRKALDHVKSERVKTGLGFRNAGDSFTLFLGTALVFYQSPRHHQEAKDLFDKILQHDSSSTLALIGIGLIYEEEEQFSEAIEFLTRAADRDPNNIRVRTEAAWVKALKGDYETSKDELEACIALLLEKNKGSKGSSNSKELLAQTQYRLGSCLWNLDTSKEARKSRTGAYAYFLEALKNNLNYAPAYTSLGLYYADYAKDQKRARKCFQKAIELSPSEVLSAERLARSFADSGDWDRVELVAQRVVDSGKVKPPPGSKRKGISWPFAALGVSELSKQDYHKSIVSFQAALRISPDDYHSWVGLGESYYSSGRYVAATKAILHAQKLEEAPTKEITGDTWFTKYMLANVKRELCDFDDAIELYREVIKSRPNEEGVCIAFMQTTVESAFDAMDKGFFGKSVSLAVDVLQFASQAPPDLANAFNFWKAVGDSCSIFSSIQSRVTEFPADLLRDLLDGGETAAQYETFQDIDGVGTGIIMAKGLFADDEKVGVDLTRCLQAAILAHKRAIYVSAHDVHAQAVSYYNLGWAEYRAHTCLPRDLRARSSRYLKAAIRCFKRAIELEAGNSEFWNSLGVVTSHVNPAVSQHSFVRSLYLNERGAHAWTNLGTLALLQPDIKLAHEAFTRAQSTDPEYAHAWLGQGLVALLMGNSKEARLLLTHAMQMSECSSVATRRLYSVTLFDHILSCPRNMPLTDLIQPIFALGQLKGLRHLDLAYSHLHALLQERSGDSTHAAETLEVICASTESEYEIAESPQALKYFALAKTDLARSYLASGLYEKAIEAGELAIQLSSDESDNELTGDERKKARLSAHLTVELAQYYSGEAAEALACFNAVLEESDENPDAVCVLAQVLWATGEDEARERAREMLYGAIETAPNHTQSVLLLGVIALLDGDQEGLDAVTTELEGFRTTADGVTFAEQSQISEVLRAMVVLGEQNSDENILNQTQTDIMMHPYLPYGWSELASFGDARDDSENTAEMGLRVARRGVPPRGDLGAEDLAMAYAATGRAADAQTAIVVAPWETTGWAALQDAVNS